MFNSSVLDVGIGLVFVYLLLSLICTAANEWLAKRRKLRARTLETGLRQMLGGSPTAADVTDQFYEHPLIKSISPPDGKPSYIPARVFAAALLDIVGKGRPLASLQESRSQNSTYAHALQSLTALPNSSDPAELPHEVETWFNDGMDRLSGWYKRRMQAMTWLVAAVITIVANADTLEIASRLWTQPALRSAVVERAKLRAQGPPLNVEYSDPESPLPAPPAVTPPDKAAASVLSEDERNTLADLLGWSVDFARLAQATKDSRGGLFAIASGVGSLMVAHLAGWIFTIFAISLGAPFWFDTLNRLINIRSAGRSPGEPQKPGKAPEEKRL